ncbi:hypothetical protein PCANC_10257 [Puccinia coronata f. sp. avenae]|uniref:Uncharacterized protein n=1 Tax=Puccinia coronata f. sp. avenae TaxID=200324 RepID=A0A2N5VQG9_9BASI|nr:hypothetical protein PCANC_10257 [Puccinia coronata f. sp. avenae]
MDVDCSIDANPASNQHPRLSGAVLQDPLGIITHHHLEAPARARANARAALKEGRDEAALLTYRGKTSPVGHHHGTTHPQIPCGTLNPTNSYLKSPQYQPLLVIPANGVRVTTDPVFPYGSSGTHGANSGVPNDLANPHRGTNWVVPNGLIDLHAGAIPQGVNGGTFRDGAPSTVPYALTDLQSHSDPSCEINTC